MYSANLNKSKIFGEYEIINQKSINKVLEYSEEPEKLKELISQLKINVTYDGFRKYFNSDTDKRIVLNVTIKRGQKEISFPFGMSLVDSASFVIYHNNPRLYMPFGKMLLGKLERAQRKALQPQKRNEVLSGLLYDILTTIRSESYTPEVFDDFISEFGYEFKTEKDYLKIKQVHLNCVTFSHKVTSMFNNEEIECLPA